MKRDDEGMAARPRCMTCGSVIWTTSNTKRRKYCSIECYQAKNLEHARRAAALRHAPPRPLAKSTVLAVGQTVRVPVAETMTVGGKAVTVTGTHIGTIRKIDGETVLVSVGKRKTCEYTAQQIKDAMSSVTEYHAKFGEAMPLGSQDG